ncbi:MULTISPECIES: class I SAM-dependent methyltransferase [Acinetobacter]|jgi:ubiquinone/menaquinone biosynthesis C-methylase UbiE|uniref:class I SAM-dependent methyltransferase n=1 Tax=Acinetobacter TaxID=469 RepID=UPI001443B097|nr:MULTISPECIES: class I SAM-dependent methyltransferase [Acinetobacter]MBF4521772.1 class I SAM-dependent methyltransferase [Acinetobacter towneri]MBT0888121.1 methyltransferase domain-containing protein [Acinetobacter towneri]MDM1486211.1 class I SAM-dependent methyltransferase [Acinetobacter towneri]NWJ93528.1 class I SAM-dependent methyltransferase [Acinetobacter sp. Swhac1]
MLYRLYQKHIFPHLLNQVMQTPSLMDLRRELLLGVSGEVLEIGFGTGINLAFYQNIDTVYALEPNAAVFQLAQERIDAAPFLVEHIAASAEQLPFADEQLQHVVSTWTLCSIADLAQSLREIYRVLQPGGTLHVVEHVLNRQSLNIQRLQHLLTPIQKKVADGCHLNRDIEVALLETGFELGEVRYIDVAGIPSLAQRMLLARVHKPK